MSPRAASSGALCFVVDDEPAIGRFIDLAARGFGVEVEQFLDLPSMSVALTQRAPRLIFLDVSLGASDAIEAIRLLSTIEYRGVVQLMSGRDAALLDDVRLIGERHGLRMRPALSKPFRVDAVKKVIDEEELLSGALPQIATPDTAEADASAWPSIRLDEALAEGHVEIWYQPKIDLRRPGLAGAEGLARIRHPRHGIVPPAAFLPDADEASLIALADYALRTVLRDTEWFAANGFPLVLAANIPVEALVSLPITGIVAACPPAVREHAVGIILEVTEDQVVRDIDRAHEIATQLRIHGIGLALDDFGNGYSSLSRLKDLPFAELKLDRSFVTGSGSNPLQAALCRTVAELAHRFGCAAVAEGVETMADLETVRAAGCDAAQGFLFARAMPREALLARLLAEGPDAGFASVVDADLAGGLRAAG